MASALKLATRRDRDPLERRQHYQQLLTEMWSDRGSYDAHWRMIGDFVRPRRMRFSTTDKNKGDRRSQSIIDSTATFASNTCRAGLHSGLTSPARPWYKFTVADPDLRRRKSVQAWLEDVTRRTAARLAMSNVYQSLPTVYGDEADFGTAAMALFEDEHTLFRTQPFPIGSYAVQYAENGQPKVFAHKYQLTTLDLVEQFALEAGYRDINWSKMPRHVKDAWDRGRYLEKTNVVWMVTPNTTYRPGSQLTQEMRWHSCYFVDGGDTVRDSSGMRTDFLRESGFHRFPVLIPRWEVTDADNYGTSCPGMDALGDIMQLQMEQKEKGKAIQKMVSPPMVGAMELRNQTASVLPGSITFTREPQHGFRPAYEVRFDIGDLKEDMAEVRYRIQRAYFEDLFLMMARSDQQLGADRPTAAEIAERKEEKMIVLGPMLERNKVELHDPMLEWVYETMWEAGEIPDPPPELENTATPPEYTSILHQAQKLIGVNSQDRLLTSVAGLTQIWPEARHKIDVRRVVDNYQDLLGADPLVVREDEDAAALEQADQAQAAAAQMAANIQATAGAAKDASQAQLQDGTSALDQVLGATAGV